MARGGGVLPAPFGPVRAIRSGPRTARWASADGAGAADEAGLASAAGLGVAARAAGLGVAARAAGCQEGVERPVRVRTVRPAGTVVAGRSTRISAWSRTECSASWR